ncbi:DUF4157 domain-containing protein [Streptomyces sp. NPDC020742]|uniref:eCIS core domain-containing protein n=1 Tax=unclassified Streptomyces TaxID=2593676 RepID=UPI0033F72213
MRAQDRQSGSVSARSRAARAGRTTSPDTTAQQSAGSVNAHADPAGSHLVLQRGRRGTSCAAGRRLLAHE